MMGSWGLRKAATLDELLHQCIHCFDENGDVNEHVLPRVFLLMHRWYISSTELAQKILCLYRSCKGEQCEETRMKMCFFMRFWIQTFPAEFSLDLGLVRIIEEFRDWTQRLGSEQQSALLDISSIPSFDWMRRVTQKRRTLKKGKASLLFDHLEPSELAEHLTFIELKALRRISFPDYQSYVVHGHLVQNPTLERSISLFNGLSHWVQLMVLSKLTPQSRAEVISKFIHVAQKLLFLQNFNTLMAVVGGLSHSAICRLRETHSYLPPEVLKTWADLTELVSSRNNYGAYRKSFSECRGPKIPILGVHLKDLIAVHVLLPDWTEDSHMIHLGKMQHLYVTLNELMTLQSTTPGLDTDPDLLHLLTLSLDLCYTEDEIYELSLLREPRSKSLPSSPVSSSPSSPSRPLAPLDWAQGLVSKPNPTLVNKHIRKVVGSVFRSYDLDRDGFISQQDFENIAANFPFLDSFCVLDKDQDGLISKAEMEAYFLRALPLLQKKMGPGFLHNFTEITYLKPTFCEHCTGFLWGIIKQGYRCKDCGVNVHRQCRDLLVLACRKLLRSRSMVQVSTCHSSVPCSPALITTDEEDIFDFPSPVSPSSPSLTPSLTSSPSLTLLTGSAHRISVKLQRSTKSQSTQTDPVWTENHTFPKPKARRRGRGRGERGGDRGERGERERDERKTNETRAVDKES
ncbi:ras guanyl-releasing protein 3 [Periophthalmus magnuspinnatus]|uniref:ras guanyl-releasing protein 3 n=1 Tax=Periophthalmus magnuspinnatus TaxID=409849 RepID=UPI0024366BB2|nr:ras guanyl-releasing protein 3 [Periophthalmus magnuspinnatus]XP_055083397.1 ras guanyl-releasing protein 3 [Periophthalmus magnuspinnatus]